MSDTVQMSLGELIAELEKLPPHLEFPEGFGRPRSWRGDYAQLAFEPSPRTRAGGMLAKARSAVEEVFEGYKGGDYLMTNATLVNIADWGEYDGDADHLTRGRWAAMVERATGSVIVLDAETLIRPMFTTPLASETPAPALQLFYFSRSSQVGLGGGKHLVSGVIEAIDLAAAKAQLDDALARSRDRAGNFAFQSLVDVERGPSGILAITMAEA